MNARAWQRLGVLTLLAAATLSGCGEYIEDPWLSGGQAELLGDELQRAPATAEALDHRLRYRVAGYGIH